MIFGSITTIQGMISPNKKTTRKKKIRKGDCQTSDILIRLSKQREEMAIGCQGLAFAGDGKQKVL